MQALPPRCLVFYCFLGMTFPRLPRAEAITVSSITSSSASIVWLLTERYNSSRPETYLVHYGRTPSQLNLTTPELPATPSSQFFSTQLTSLRPGTVYYYRIEARNRFETIFTAEMSFRTENQGNLLSIIIIQCVSL